MSFGILDRISCRIRIALRRHANKGQNDRPLDEVTPWMPEWVPARVAVTEGGGGVRGAGGEGESPGGHGGTSQER